MSYFPQPNPASPARRMKVGNSVAATVHSHGNQPVNGKLHDVSVTGGLLFLPKAMERGEFVEVAFQTSHGMVRGMAELLEARRQSASGCVQPFRFVALNDEDHSRLRMAVDSMTYQKSTSSSSIKRKSL